MKASGLFTLVLAFAAPVAFTAPAPLPATVEDLGARQPQVDARNYTRVFTRQEEETRVVTKRSDRSFAFRPRDMTEDAARDVARDVKSSQFVAPRNYTSV